jgi:hypothetical protein
LVLPSSGTPNYMIQIDFQGWKNDGLTINFDVADIIDTVTVADVDACSL